MTDAARRPVFIGMPTHDARCHADIVRAILAACMFEDCAFDTQSWSLLAKNFNHLLAAAINNGKYRYFCLLHADIVPQDPRWLSKMLDEMESTGADILSVVSPIKNFKGVSSTALMRDVPAGEDPTPPVEVRRLTMNEIMERPETFTDPLLVVNTGLMLVDLQAPWIGKVWFEIKDRVIFEDGKYKAVTIPEDWLFSLRARQHGARIYATRKVPILHVGNHGFPNNVHYPDGAPNERWKLS